jgi:hypothetical protein
MKSSLIKGIATTCFLIYSAIYGNTIAAEKSFGEIVYSQFESAKGTLPSNWHIRLLGEPQRLHRANMNAIALTGTVRDPNVPNKTDCFVFIAGVNQPGKFFFTSSKADQAWQCIANPEITIVELKNRAERLVIASIFQFQAFSGEKFYLPFIFQKNSANELQLGELDACTDAALKNEQIMSLTQVVRAVKRCATH